MDLFPPTEVSVRDPASECSQGTNPVYMLIMEACLFMVSVLTWMISKRSPCH